MEELATFVQTHGNSFHSRVAKKLRDNGWSVLVSPYYRDNATDKAREADIIAEKEIKFGMDGSPTILNGFFRVRLIIECKYVKDPIVFWFDDKDPDAVEERIIKEINICRKSELNNSILKHHWRSSTEAGKLFATHSTNGQEKSQESEVIFSAVDKVLNCLINYRGRPSTVKNKNPGDYALYQPIITYPVIILDSFSKLFDIKIGDTAAVKTLNRENNFEIEVNYESVRYVSGARVLTPEYFLVDVVDFTKIENYLSMLKDKDLTMALNFL